MGVFRQNQRRGAALMLSLWALFLLSAMVISWALEIDSRLTLQALANRNLEAEAMACSGAEVAMHPQMTPDSKALVGGFGKGQRYEARITGESGRLNLKWLLVGEKPGQLEFLRKYLEIKGVDLNERDRMIDTLLDWIDPDNLVRLNGAEDEGGYKPANRMLTSIDELKKIKGWEEFTSSKNWDIDFTLDTQAAGPNLLWASKDVIMALPGMNEMRVDQFIALRRGPDEIEGTEDDGIKSLPEAANALGIPPDQLQNLGVSFLPFGQDQVLRVVSIGKSGDFTRTVRVVFQKGSNQLKSWKEY
jgi:general secretion pathway protein K